jgi:formylglycine-generating enzyme required for sulfatase activity
MGSPEDEEGREEDEGPRHGVIIAAPFAVGRYQVTRAEYARFVEATGRSEGDGCDIKTGGEWIKEPGKGWRDPGYEQTDRDPVVCVSWNDAQAYAGWLSDKTDKNYRLLTEAEWEYAARAGASTSYRWGDTIGSDNANCDGCGSQWDDERTAPVGSFDPSRFGLYDTAGNVWEWVEDCWNGSYEDAPTNGSAWTTGRCQLRIRRGGSWASNPRKLRPADRHRVDFEERNHRNGFRVARTLL